MPEGSGTQREDRFHMEPLHGARPKWNQVGGPPVVPEESGGRSHRKYGWPGLGGAQSSGSTVATASAEHAGGGSSNTTEEGG